MTQELLFRFLNDHCTNEELNEVIQWIKNEALLQDGRKLGLIDWNNFQASEDLLENEQIDSMLNKIHQKIILSQNQSSKKTSKALFISWLTKAAAILLLPVLGILFFMLFNQKAENPKTAGIMADSLQIITPVGSRTVLQLPDGTKAYLNNSSKLTYPQKFIGKSRQVVLIGEGYFEVAHDPDKPFIVHAGNLRVMAVGTKFNVMAFPGEKVIATTLADGKVIVEQTIPGGGIKPIGALIPGQHIVYHKETGKVISTQGNIEKYISWKDGRLIFDNESITNIAECLERMFNVDIEIANEIKDYTYTVTFIDEPFFQILDLMKIATPVEYKAQTRKKLPDGSYSRQKIVIYKRNP
jgi:ferric-dicitrate binding protein FerR (iron transport regulator)